MVKLCAQLYAGYDGNAHWPGFVDGMRGQVPIQTRPMELLRLQRLSRNKQCCCTPLVPELSESVILQGGLR